MVMNRIPQVRRKKGATAAYCILLHWLLMKRRPAKKSLRLTAHSWIHRFSSPPQVSAGGAPWRVPTAKYHQPWYQLLPHHRTHHLDTVWDPGGGVHRSRPRCLQPTCRWVHAPGRWDLNLFLSFFLSLANFSPLRWTCRWRDGKWGSKTRAG